MDKLLALTLPGGETLQAPNAVPTGGLENNGTASRVVSNSITILLILIAVVSLFFLIFGGIKWISSSGDKAKMDSARKTILYAVLGILLSFLSFFIVTVVSSVFGVDFFGT